VEREALRKANDGLAKLLHEEEGKWAQHAKVKHVQEEEIRRYIFTLLQMVSTEKR
jgi:hypothetical protein